MKSSRWRRPAPLSLRRPTPSSLTAETVGVFEETVHVKALQLLLHRFQTGAFGKRSGDFEGFGREFKPSLLLCCVQRGNVGVETSQQTRSLMVSTMATNWDQDQRWEDSTWTRTLVGMGTGGAGSGPAPW